MSTKVITTVIAVIIVVIDIVLIALGWDSISYVVYSNAKQYPLIPFAFGVLMGHFFWPVKDKKDE